MREPPRSIHLTGDTHRTRLPAGDPPDGEADDFTALATEGLAYTKALTSLTQFAAGIVFIWMLASIIIAPAAAVMVVKAVWP